MYLLLCDQFRIYFTNVSCFVLQLRTFPQIITGPVMVAGDHKFHPECFVCTSCTAFIGDGESYALVERSKLYW